MLIVPPVGLRFVLLIVQLAFSLLILELLQLILKLDVHLLLLELALFEPGGEALQNASHLGQIIRGIHGLPSYELSEVLELNFPRLLCGVLSYSLCLNIRLDLLDYGGELLG